MVDDNKKNNEENKPQIDNTIAESQPFEDTRSAFFYGQKWNNLGKSAGGKDILGKQISANPKLHDKSFGKILLIGGVHGNETEGVKFMVEFVKEFALNDITFILLDIYA